MGSCPGNPCFPLDHLRNSIIKINSGNDLQRLPSPDQHDYLTSYHLTTAPEFAPDADTQAVTL